MKKGSQHGRPEESRRHPHEVVATDLWRATSEGDSESIRRRLAPDVLWQTFSRGILSGSLRGPDAVLDLFARVGELVDDLENELLDVSTSGRG